MPVSIRVLWFQGVFYLATAIWPLADIMSFQAITGPKADHLPFGNQADHWLVNSVAVLIFCIGLVYVFAAYRRKLSAEVILLAISAPAVLTLIDCIYVLRGVLRPVYLVDAAAEIAFILYWSFVLGKNWRLRFKRTGEQK